MRRSVFFTLSQAERRGRLHCSDWPNLDWENEWVMLTTYKDFDRSIDMDAVSGKLQEAFGIPEEWHAPRVYSEERVLLENVETREEAMEYLQQVKDRHQVEKERIEDWSDQWGLCEPT